jgi:mRNA interferase MazF
LKRGTVVLANLDPTPGHEQRGLRPCVVVTDPTVIAHQRYELFVIVPLTSKPQAGSLYPVVEPDPLAGVRLRSYALTDQLRSIDKRRIQSFAQKPLAPDVMHELDRALRMLLDL